MPKALLHSTPWMAVNQANEKTVEIDISGLIGGSFWDLLDPNSEESKNTREKMKAELKALSEIKAQKIIVNIDSPGGDVAHGLSIHDMLVQHPADIETRIYGLTASIATVIAEAGNKRTISDNALMLVHRSSYGIMGIFNQTELKTAVNDLNKFDDRIINIYEKRSGTSKDVIESLMNENIGNGKWIDGTEAKDLGLIDEVFEPQMRAAASYDKNLFNKLKYPVIPENMTKKAEETRTLFDKMKDAFNAVFQTASKDAKVPQDVTDKLTEFDSKLKELEAENTTISNDLKTKTDDITAKDLKITELTNQVATSKTDSDKAIAEAKAEKELAEKEKNEAIALKKTLTDLKNEWIPERRTKGTGSVEDGVVDKATVKENLKKLKNEK